MNRNGGLGSSSKLVRLIVVSTVFDTGFMTLIVFESSFAIKTRSRLSISGASLAPATELGSCDTITAAPMTFRKSLLEKSSRSIIPSFQRSVDDEGDRRGSAGSEWDPGNYHGAGISGRGLPEGIPVGPGLREAKGVI